MDIGTLKLFVRSMLGPTKSLIVTGPAGIGKSSAVRELAQEMGREVIDLRLSEMEPADLVGLPYIVKGKGSTPTTTHYAQPHYWPNHGNVILFLDEVDRAREDMQPVAMQLCLDRTAGGRKLPDGVIIIAAANGEKYMTSAIDQALMDRFAVVELTPSVGEWVTHAESVGCHPAVTRYISMNPGRLDTPDNLIGVPNVVSPSRRSWLDVGLAFARMQKETPGFDLAKFQHTQQFTVPYVGITEGTTFAIWVETNFKSVSAEDIYNGVADPKLINSPLQCSAVTEQIAESFLQQTVERQSNACNFYMACGAEIFASLFAALPTEANVVLEKLPGVDKFINDSIDELSSYLPPQE